MHCIDHSAPRLYQLQEMISYIINSPQYYKWKIISHTDKHTQKTVASQTRSLDMCQPSSSLSVVGAFCSLSLPASFPGQMAHKLPTRRRILPPSNAQSDTHALTYCKHIHTASPLPKLCNTILPAPRTWVWKSWSIFINPQPTHCCCNTDKAVYL